MNWFERGTLAMQRSVGKTVVYNPHETKIMAGAKDYGSAVATALRVPDSAALTTAASEWNSLPIEARAACNLTEAQAIAKLAKGQPIF
jgi:hypothetical protein